MVKLDDIIIPADCRHDPWIKGAEGGKCPDCGHTEINPVFWEKVARAVSRGEVPDCPICREAMTRLSPLVFYCRYCDFTARRPGLEQWLSHALKNRDRHIVRQIYEVIDGEHDEICFCCNRWSLQKVGKTSVSCRFCRFIVTRRVENEKIVWYVNFF